MPRARKVCSCLRCPAHEGYGCPNTVPHGVSRCPTCTTQADRARGTRHERGYDYKHETLFRPAVLKNDPLCVCTTEGHGHTGQCRIPSTVADHYPRSRRELVALGLNPYDPQYGRGLCGTRCHSPETARRQPGGWAQRSH